MVRLQKTDLWELLGNGTVIVQNRFSLEKQSDCLFLSPYDETQKESPYMRNLCKRILALLLVLALMAGLTACSGIGFDISETGLFTAGAPGLC